MLLSTLGTRLKPVIFSKGSSYYNICNQMNLVKNFLCLWLINFVVLKTFENNYLKKYI